METKTKWAVAGIVLIAIGACWAGFIQLQKRAKAADVIGDEAEWDLRDAAVRPLPVRENVDSLSDGIYPVSFGQEDVVEAEGGYRVTFEVFSMDLYDAMDIQRMTVGGYIEIDGDLLKIESLSGEGGVVINGGLENGGAELIPNGGGTYRYQGWDDIATYSSLGKVTFTIPDTVDFVDNGHGGDISDVIVVPGTGVFDYLTARDAGSFDKHSARIRVENGSVVEFRREFRP